MLAMNSNPPVGENYRTPDYVHYTPETYGEEFCDEFHADMRRRSPLQQRSEEGIVYLEYEPAEYDFRAFVGDALANAGMLPRQALRDCGDRLELVHQWIDTAHQEHDASQQSAAARVLYDMPQAFAALYQRLLREIVLPDLDLGPSYHQQTPTFRVFFPHARGYPGHTSYHSDIMLGHNPREVNIFVPLVPCEGTRSLLFADLPTSLQLYEEYEFDFARFGRDTQQQDEIRRRCAASCRPLQLAVGQIAVFDARCLHAGPANTTDWTRVSFDTRVLPANELQQQANRYRGRGRQRAEFLPGRYFASEALSPMPVATNG